MFKHRIKSNLAQAFTAVVLGFSSLSSAFAEPTFVRWTAKDDPNADFTHLLEKLNQTTGFNLQAADFVTAENRPLAYNRFSMFHQTAAGVPIKSASIRIWTDLNDPNKLVQFEAYVEGPVITRALSQRARALSRGAFASAVSNVRLDSVVRAAVAKHRDDRAVRKIEWSKVWSSGQLVNVAEVTSKHGKHTITISAETGKVLSQSYQSFPQIEKVMAQVFPIYEQPDGTSPILPRETVELKYLKDTVKRAGDDPFAVLRTQRYYEDKLDPILGETAEGRSQGYWSSSYLKNQAKSILAALPDSPNTFADGLILEGQYATISLNPDVARAFPRLPTPHSGAQYVPAWKEVQRDGEAVYEMIPQAALAPAPFYSADAVLTASARRLKNHDVVSYLQDGFDGIQVYYAINQLFDSLRPKGFIDPDLSERAFNAFLYDPDISSRDNAYYSDDTINFTTYSSDQQNMARDNPTIWHELGHGVMDRLMGDFIRLADTGGLSEGMADFVADLVVNDVSKGDAFPGSDAFRIINGTGFLLTNEVHDDGESYGGTMHDLLKLSMAKDGPAIGLKKITDLTMEAMRLARNHPKLTAQDWFNRMLFADELGRDGVRAPGELRDILLKALAGRNFNLDGAAPARMDVFFDDGKELLSRGPGSRGNDIPHELAPTETASHHLKVSLKDSERYQFKFPVTVTVDFNAWALEGSVHWVGEENGQQKYTLNNEGEVLDLDLAVSGKCDAINREDGSCSDYAYIRIYNDGDAKTPVAKKRFYVRVFPKP